MNHKNVIAGPCAFESRKQAKEVIKFLVEDIRINKIRGGFKKYRSDPNTYQGSIQVLEWIKELKQEYEFDYYGEIFSYEDLLYLRKYNLIDVIQIGSRNMYNTDLLTKINNYSKDQEQKVKVLYKHFFAASLQEFVMHSQYLKDCDVTLCLRGAFSIHKDEQRFTHNYADIARLKELTKNKICYDVSHSSCNKKYINDAVLGALIYKPDNLMIEVHPTPDQAYSDPQQQLNFKEFERIIKKI